MTQEIRDAVARAMREAVDDDGDHLPWEPGGFWTRHRASEFLTTAALTALSACEPTPEMVEAAAQVERLGIDGATAFEVQSQLRHSSVAEAGTYVKTGSVMFASASEKRMKRRRGESQ